MLRLLAFVLLAAPAAAQTTFGSARFTVIAPELIRLEWQARGRFVDEPSLFAADRSTRYDGYREERSPGELVLDTGRIRLTYRPDGKPFHAGNLEAFVRGAERPWKAGDWSGEDLGGARNLDNLKGPDSMEPGLLGRVGWRVLDDSTRPLLTGGWVAARPRDAGQDWYLFGYGRDYKAALRALTTISGRSPMPRKYVLGSWYSRWWPHSAADYRRIAGEYEAHGFPLDVVVLDMDWHEEGWTGYAWNKTLFPDPAGFLAWLHAHGLFVTLNDHLAGESFDAGDRARMDALFSSVYAPLEKQGVDFWWIDSWSEDAARPFNHLRWVNDLYYRRSQHDGLRGQIFSRWADWGGQRQPIQFSGDAYIEWPVLKFEVPFTANAGNAGAFFWAHDVGGYQGKRSPELLARWTQFAAFSAAMRLHSMNKPWLDKRPWSYGKDVEDSMRTAFRLRSELFPYTYTAVHQVHADSLPLLRPLYLECPDDERAYQNPEEYLYGDSFLVAPIVEPGTGPKHLARRKVWLPAGTWYDWFTGARFTGPVERDFEAPLSTFPVFARGGVPIPMQPYTPRMGTAPLKTLVVRAYPGEDGVEGSSALYEDDGLTLAYSTGAYATTELRYLRAGGRVQVVIGAAKGSYAGQPGRRSYVVELPGLGEVVGAAANGKSLTPSVDPKTKIARFHLGEQDIRQDLLLRVETR